MIRKSYLRLNNFIENRIYISGEFTRKGVKRPFCCTVSILQVRKSKIIVKRKSNYEIGLFHNLPMIISHRLYAFHFTNDDFPL